MSTTTTITTPERVELQPQPTAVVRFQALQEELAAHFDRAYAATVAAIEASGARVAGPPFGAPARRVYPTSMPMASARRIERV